MIKFISRKKRCKAITSRGKRCKRRTKYYFCKQHWKSKLKIKSIIIGLLSVIIGIGGFYADVFQPLYRLINPPTSWTCEQDKNIRGIILESAKTEKIDFLDVQLGFVSDAIITSNGKIKLSTDKSACVPPFPVEETIGIPNDCPLWYRIDENNTLYVSSLIYNGQGCLVGEIFENQFLINNNCSLTYNQDNTAIEVIDNENDVVISLEFNPPKTIIYQGVFHGKKRHYVIGDQQIEIIPRDDPIGLYNSKKKLKKIFRYTGKDWFGKRANDK